MGGIIICGESGIRTHGTVASTRTFQARSFGHSDTSPEGYKSIKISHILHFDFTLLKNLRNECSIMPYNPSF